LKGGEKTMNMPMYISSNTGSAAMGATGHLPGGQTDAAGKDFALLMTQVLGGTTQDGSSAFQNGAMPLLTLLTPELLALFGAEQSEGDLVQLDALIEKLTSLLDSDQAEELVQDPGMMQWFATIEVLLPALTNRPEVQAKATVQGTEAEKQGAVSDSKLSEYKSLLERFAAEYRMNPGQELLRQMAAALVQATQSWMAGTKQAGYAVPHSMESSLELFTPMSQGSVATGSSPASKLAGAEQFILQRNGNVHTAEVQAQTASNAHNPLNVLAAKSMIPYAIVSTAAANSTGQASPEASLEQVDSPAAPVVQAGDLLRGQSDSPLIKSAPKEVHVSTFVREIAEMAIKQMKVVQGNGITEATLKLMPEHLGQVDIKISIQNGQVVAQFLADSIRGKEMLESQLAQLRTALQGQGLQVDKLEVTQTHSSASSMFQDPRHQQRQNRSFSQPSRNGRGAEGDAIDFDLSMNEDTPMHELELGSTFVATA
jgi:flagellar hook-length control protein FliK